MVDGGPTASAPCPGCGALVPSSDGPTHPYLGASPGCWVPPASPGEVTVLDVHAAPDAVRHAERVRA